MTYQEQTAALEAKIAKAEQDLHVWRQAGVSERYLECYFLAMSLDLQLQQHLSRRTAH